jgi:hypothetical protein
MHIVILFQETFMSGIEKFTELHGLLHSRIRGVDDEAPNGAIGRRRHMLRLGY